MSCPYCNFSRGLGKQHLGDYSRLQSNMFSPKTHAKWKWRHIIRGAFWKYENQESFLFITMNCSLLSKYFNSISWSSPVINRNLTRFSFLWLTEILQLAGCKGGCRQKRLPCCRCCGGWRSILEIRDLSTLLQASIETTFLYSCISGIIY